MKKIFFRGVGGGGFPYERGGDARRLALGCKFRILVKRMFLKRQKIPIDSKKKRRPLHKCLVFFNLMVTVVMLTCIAAKENKKQIGRIAVLFSS